MPKKIALSIFSALLLAAPFLFPWLFPLAWVAFVPLFWVIHQAESWGRAVFFGWLTGFVAHLVGFYWLVYTIHVFGGFSNPISAVFFLIYAALQGLEIAFFAMLLKYYGSGPMALFPPLFWVALEFWFPLLFPWHLANSQSAFTLLIQTADLVGPYGASFLIMWLNAITADALLKRMGNLKISWGPVTVFALCLGASLIYGWIRLDEITNVMSAAPKLSVAAVQADINVGMKWDPKQMNANLNKHIDLTREATGARVVLWPESAIEEWLPDDLRALPAQFMKSLSLNGAYFIFGARSFLGSSAGRNFKAFNSAFLTDAAGRVLGRYHKQVLLAFGEYLPFASILSKLPAIPFADGFTPGDGPHTLDLPGGIRIAPLICYEDLIPELSRRFARDTKANVLINLTNDAWYGNTVAPWQHLRLAQWRAIETRRALLRVTNTGVTSVVNAKGQWVEVLPLFTPAVLNAQVEILNDLTFYVRSGDWFAWGATFISIAIVLFLSVKKISAIRMNRIDVPTQSRPRDD
jgi:apolipoprotein N-acyltransferase